MGISGRKDGRAWASASILTDHSCTRRKKTPELKPSQFLEAMRWMLGNLVGGKKVVHGTFGFKMMVSASNQLFK